MKRIFTYISETNLWQSAESVSGRGSELECTESIRTFLPKLFKEFQVESILDAPCGDFNWMRHVPLSGLTYTGIDVVPEIVKRNQEKYGTDTIQFKPGDITKDTLPKVDLIICRDCLVHLPLWYGCLALRQFKRSGSKYLLATTYPHATVNNDTPLGSWRSLNLSLPPFNCGDPILLISDPSDDTGKNPDKSLGLWELDAIDPQGIWSLSSPQVMLTSLVRQYFDPSWKL
jgi:hypothetical protein